MLWILLIAFIAINPANIYLFKVNKETLGEKKKKNPVRGTT